MRVLVNVFVKTAVNRLLDITLHLRGKVNGKNNLRTMPDEEAPPML